VPGPTAHAQRRVGGDPHEAAIDVVIAVAVAAKKRKVVSPEGAQILSLRSDIDGLSRAPGAAARGLCSDGRRGAQRREGREHDEQRGDQPCWHLGCGPRRRVHGDVWVEELTGAGVIS